MSTFRALVIAVKKRPLGAIFAYALTWSIWGGSLGMPARGGWLVLTALLAAASWTIVIWTLGVLARRWDHFTTQRRSRRAHSTGVGIE